MLIQKQCNPGDEEARDDDFSIHLKKEKKKKEKKRTTIITKRTLDIHKPRQP